MAKATTPCSPASRMAPSTVMVSMVPPDAQLSLWSSSTMGPALPGLALSKAKALAMDTGKASIW